MAKILLTLFSLFLIFPLIFSVENVAKMKDGIKHLNLHSEQNVDILGTLKEKIKTNQIENWLWDKKTLDLIHQKICQFSNGPKNVEKIQDIYKIDKLHQIRIENWNDGGNDSGKLIEKLEKAMNEICNFKEGIGSVTNLEHLKKELPELLTKVFEQNGNSMLAKFSNVKIVLLSNGKQIGEKHTLEDILAKTQQEIMKPMKTITNAVSPLKAFKNTLEDFHEILTQIAGQMNDRNEIKKMLEKIVENKGKSILPSELLKLANHIFMHDFGHLTGAKNANQAKLTQHSLHSAGQHSNFASHKHHPLVAAIAAHRRRRRRQAGGEGGGGRNPFRNMSEATIHLLMILVIVIAFAHLGNILHWGVIMPVQGVLHVGGDGLGIGTSLLGSIMRLIFGLATRYPLICLGIGAWLYISFSGKLPPQIARFFSSDDNVNGGGGQGHGGHNDGGAAGAFHMN